MGQFIDSDERWEFYSAEDFQRPSKHELKYMKGIIIGSSISFTSQKPKGHVIKNKEPKDANILKQIAKKETSGGMFDIDDKSSIGNTTSLGGEKNNF